ncbi:methyltransferase domain-containing protein [Microvirga massiliensis]|uniref:methyltransferase domain-containing protein n=1 Tax=Microvirga massiliensis TaxID=1033741 RepID=UPI0006601BA4
MPKNGYVWFELSDDRYDVAISGQTFEHNPFFWVTFCEMARILKPGGVLFVIAPGGGRVHRFPYDCWRFYPDSWGALCTLSGMHLVETYFEKDSTAAQGVRRQVARQRGDRDQAEDLGCRTIVLQ